MSQPLQRRPLTRYWYRSWSAGLPENVKNGKTIAHWIRIRRQVLLISVDYY